MARHILAFLHLHGLALRLIRPPLHGGGLDRYAGQKLIVVGRSLLIQPASQVLLDNPVNL